MYVVSIVATLASDPYPYIVGPFDEYDQAEAWIADHASDSLLNGGNVAVNIRPVWPPTSVARIQPAAENR